MAQTIDRTFHGQIIAGAFSDREDAEKAISAFEDAGVNPANIQIHQKRANPPYSRFPSEGGVSTSQTNYYDAAVRKGQIVVTVCEVNDPALIIDIFDAYHASYIPNASRNLRQDVLGMTAGAAMGGTAGGVGGAVVGGSPGAAAGLAAGALVGAGAGAAVGKAAEHNK
jgi:hypothetical protein